MDTVYHLPPTKRIPRKPHYLVSRIRGTINHDRGHYLCKCGESFTGANKFETHRAIRNKAETSL